jgi:hypothetical protein
MQSYDTLAAPDAIPKSSPASESSTEISELSEVS